MSKSSKRKTRKDRVRRQTFLSGGPGSTGLDPAARTWPIVRAFVPMRDAWLASGMGTAGIVRQRPDGQLATAFFWLDFADDGLHMMWGDEAATAERVEEGLQTLGDKLPPLEEGSADLAARYIWGSHAWGLSRGFEWPKEQSARFLGLVPRLSGTMNWWLQQFIGPDVGLVPPGLSEYVAQHPAPEDLPEGKEAAVLTTMRFEVADEAAVMQALRQSPDFVEQSQPDGLVMFGWLHGSANKPGERIPHAVIGFTEGYMAASAITLSMAATLVQELKRMLGGQVTLQRTTWLDPREMPARPPGSLPLRSETAE